jgi:pilus assembly protein Flp/PilA
VNGLIERVTSSLRTAHARQQGQGVTEYALILMLIAVVVILMLGVLGGHVSNQYSNIQAHFPH